MNTPSQRPCARVLGPLLATCLFLAAVFPTAISAADFLFQLPAGRALHSFSLESDPPNAAGSFSTGFGLNDAYAWLYLWGPDENTFYTLFDDSTGDHVGLGPFDGQWRSDLREPSVWYQGTIPSEYFIVGSGRQGHIFVLAQPNGAFYPVHSGAASPANDFFEVSAHLDLQFQYQLIDLTTNEKSPLGQTSLAVLGQQVWQSNDISPPEVAVDIWLDPAENGHSFTVWSQASGGQPRFAQVTAQRVNEAPVGVSWADGSSSTIPAHCARVQVSVGYGMQFWLSRNADNANSPAYQHNGQGYQGQPPATWSALSAFPPLPPSARNLQTVHFRINGARSGHAFSVIHPDTYAASVQPGEWGWVGSYDANGNCVSGMNYIEATAQVDMNQTSWYLHDDGDGTAFAAFATDIFDGWQPLYLAPPIGSISLNIFEGRVAHSLTLRQFAADGHELQVRAIDTSNWHMNPQVSLLWFTGSGEGGWYSPVAGLTVPIDLTIGADASDPNGTRGFSVHDAVTGEDSPFVAASSLTSAQIDLSTWYTPPIDQQLTFSRTRWFHRLALHHPSGEEYPVINGATAGDTSWSPDGAAWWNDWGIFTATSKRRDLLGYLGYRIIDYSTGESSPDAGPGVSPTDLGAWVSYDAPSASPPPPPVRPPSPCHGGPDHLRKAIRSPAMKSAARPMAPAHGNSSPPSPLLLVTTRRPLPATSTIPIPASRSTACMPIASKVSMRRVELCQQTKPQHPPRPTLTATASLIGGNKNMV